MDFMLFSATLKRSKLALTIASAILFFVDQIFMSVELKHYAVQLRQNNFWKEFFRFCFFIFKINFTSKFDLLDVNYRPFTFAPQDGDIYTGAIGGLICLLKAKKSTYYRQVCLYDLLFLRDKKESQFLREFYLAKIKKNTRISKSCESTKKSVSVNVPTVNFPKAKAQQALEDVYMILQENNIETFLVSGTLLGAIRENDFLAHDFDIDLGVFDKHVTVPEIVSILAKYSNCQIESVDNPYLVRLLVNKIVPVDIFFHFEDGNICWHGSSYHRWENELFELHEINFLGNCYQAPVNYDKYLTENYGDWRTPKIDFDCFYDTPNLKHQESHGSIIFLLKQCLYNEHVNNYERYIFFANKLEDIYGNER